MRKLKEVLRLHLTAKLSNRKIAMVTGLGKSAVSKHLRRARTLGLDWGRIEAMDESKMKVAGDRRPPADAIHEQERNQCRQYQ